MPHTKSAKKNLRKSEKRRMYNRAVKRTIKDSIKGFLAAIEEGPVEKAQEEYNRAVMRLDKAGIRGVIHPNLASRKKSQLARMLHKKKTAPPPETPT